MDYIIVPYYLMILPSSVHLLSFSSHISVSFKTDPLLFQPLCMLMFFSLLPCSGFLSEMSACTDPNWQPSFFLFFFPVKHKPYWAAGGYSHIKITVSHPVDLCMCQRVHSQTPANTHGDAHHNRKTRWEMYTKDSRLFSCVHSHLRWFIMSSICTISVFIDTLFTDIVIPVRSHLLR